MQRSVRKRFPRNPYSVINVMEFCECDLVDIQVLGKFNDSYRYLLAVIDVFSKFLHIVPMRSKTGTAVALTFGSIFKDPKYSKPLRRGPIWVQTDRGKFFNRSFQDMWKNESIQFQVCRDPNVKCAISEPSHRTIRDQLYEYFTYKSTYRYIDVLSKFVKAYNDTFHRANIMAPSKVTDSDIFAIWNMMRARQSAVKRAVAKFRVGQRVRINKGKIKFAKGGEQYYTTAIFNTLKAVHKTPCPVYELGNWLGWQIHGQFYAQGFCHGASRNALCTSKIKYCRRGLDAAF